ncbi:neutral/alkaline non-lysosomal ceramidase N-terminal domain-containing protein [Lacticaseibacillus salsurivasis]|uniref:neutral/alkaline non-lysosomal ceramidase N-terminal domain-containing protein n=1 Tax=Lacticaseibacillus salsurivasis TaxID=3081441 RepID=UPI0030C75398
MLIGTDNQLIDPQIGCEMEGYESRRSTGRHDHLTTSVFYLANGETQLLFIALDIVAVPGYRADRIKRQVTAQWQVPAEQVVIAAIHTHSGPTVTDLLLDYPDIDETYWRQIDTQTLKAVANAIQNAHPGRLVLRAATVPDGIYANRDQATMPYNRQLAQLVALDDEDKLLGALLLLGTHPTIMNVKNTQLSADLVGGVRRAYQQRFGIRPVVMLTDCGNTSTRYTRRESTFAEVTQKSEQLVAGLITATDKPVTLDHLKCKQVTLTSDYNPVTNPDAQALWTKITNETQAATGARRDELKGFLSTYQHIRDFGHTHFETHSTILDCGAFRIVTYPGELVHTLGARIRHADAKPTLLVTLANDYRGYSVNQEDFGLYFETYNSVLLRGASDEFVARIVATEK